MCGEVRLARHEAGGVSRALREALRSGGERETRGPKLPGSSVGEGDLDEIRLKIIQYLCHSPCRQLGVIAREFDLAEHTIHWHLTKLIDSGFLTSTRDRKHILYYVTGLIHSRDVPLLFALSNERARSIYRYLLENPGDDQNTLRKELKMTHQTVSWFTRRLRELELLTMVQDGKHHRFFPTGMLERLRTNSRDRVKQFRDSLISNIEKTGLKATVIRSTDQNLVLRFEVEGHRVVLRFDTDPFLTCID